jgi:hypothetical protein
MSTVPKIITILFGTLGPLGPLDASSLDHPPQLDQKQTPFFLLNLLKLLTLLNLVLEEKICEICNRKLRPSAVYNTTLTKLSPFRYSTLEKP